MTVGYLYFAEVAIFAIPGVNAVYPYLPGGATASLTDFGYLIDAMAQLTGQARGQLLPTPAGALVLLGYALTAAMLAIAFPTAPRHHLNTRANGRFHLSVSVSRLGFDRACLPAMRRTSARTTKVTISRIVGVRPDIACSSPLRANTFRVDGDSGVQCFGYLCRRERSRAHVVQH